jgi:hypothetical protein
VFNFLMRETPKLAYEPAHNRLGRRTGLTGGNGTVSAYG